MSGIDVCLEGFLQGGQVSLGLILLISVALGLRYASDPNHVAAVTTLVASGEVQNEIGGAGFTGFSWGLGHGTTLVTIRLLDFSEHRLRFRVCVWYFAAS